MENWDVLTTRRFILWIAYAAAAAILMGLPIPLLRRAARQKDPSLSAGLVAVFMTLFGAGAAYLKGVLPTVWTLDNKTLVAIAACGAVTALFWLCLITALTGGLASKVGPVVNAATVPVLVASYYLFGTSMGLWRICCLLLITLGTVLMLSRSHSLRGQHWFVYALITMLLYAGLTLMKTKLLPDSLDETVYLVGSAAVAAVLIWIFAAVRGKLRLFSSLSAATWICAPLAAAAYAGSLVCTALAARYGEMSMLAPMGILSFAVMLLASRILCRERQPVGAVFGAVLTMLGMFAILMGF